MGLASELRHRVVVQVKGTERNADGYPVPGTWLDYKELWAKVTHLSGKDLIAAQANVAADCGFHIFPDGAGHTLFSIDSDLGLYIHCLECSEC